MKKRAFIWKLITLLIVFVLIAAGCAPKATETTISPTAVTTEEVKQPTVAVMEPTKEVVAPTEAVVEPTKEVPTGETPLYGGTLVVAEEFPDYTTCDPSISTTPSSLENMFEGLATYDAEFQLHPELATSWDFSADGLTLTFHLRQGVKWHDGEPFTSADVKFSFEEAIGKFNPRGKVAFQSVDSVETPDDFTVIFHMKNPSPGFIYQIGIGESPIIPKHIYENEDVVEGAHATCQEMPIGTGPFKAGSYEPGVSFTMVRNDEWWGTEDFWKGKGMPYLDQIIALFVTDETARSNGFETGEFDYLYMEGLPAADVSRFKEMPGRLIAFECTTMPVEIQFGFNLRRDQWQDVRVRQAIAWALDREVINELGNFGNGTPSWTFFPPTSPLYNPNIATYSPPDLTKAEALLDEAGYPRGADGIRFEMDLYTLASIQDYAFVFKQQVEQTGIKVNVVAPEREIALDTVFVKHDFDVAVWGLGVNDPGIGVSRLFRSNNIGENPYNNYAAYENPEMDTLWATFSTTIDEAVRKETLFRIEEIANQDLPYIFVNTPPNWASFNIEEFSGYPQNCFDSIDQLHQVWWNGGTPTR